MQTAPQASTSSAFPYKKSSALSSVGIQDLEKRFRSKREMHDFLVQDCRAFLPKLPSTSIFFMKAVIKAEKDVSAPTTLSPPPFLSMSAQ
jgi:hypothetical protein